MRVNRRLADTSTLEKSESPELEASLDGRFRKRILTVALFRLRDRESAEDVAQETLRAVLEAVRGRRLKDLNALPAFVYETARRICMNHERKRTREARALSKLTTSRPPVPNEAALSALIDGERHDTVRRALRRLPKSDRRLLRLLYYDGLDTAIVAERLDITKGALRVRRHRALKRLSELVDDVEKAK